VRLPLLALETVFPSFSLTSSFLGMELSHVKSFRYAYLPMGKLVLVKHIQ
jgi:hypothetical protein